MSFASFEYLPFLLAVLAVHPFLAGRARVAWLVFASVVFCAWHEPAHALVLAAACAMGYAGGIAIEHASTSAARKCWLTAVVTGELALLWLAKVDAWHGLTPLGVSFYTLMHIGYAVDVFRRETSACRSPLRFALFGSFFPLLSAGPIERAPHLLPQIEALGTLTAANAWIGARRIVWGLAKKLVLADRLHVLAKDVFASPHEYSAPVVLLASLCMLAVLYADFSGYTDIARGSARLFGIELTINFRRPLMARSVPEFMRRWHISLVSWITDYVYSPLFGTRPSHARIWRANCISMGVFGIWHGGAWKFVFVGLTYGTILSIHHSVQLARARSGGRATRGRTSLAVAVLGWVTTTLLAMSFIVFFFATDLAHARAVFACIAGLGDAPIAAASAPVVQLAAILGGAFLLHASGERIDWERVWERVGALARLAYLAALVAAVLMFGARASTPFWYFQF